MKDNKFKFRLCFLGSSAWLLPNAKFWKNYPFLRTKSRNYTAHDFGDLFTKLGLHVRKLL